MSEPRRRAILFLEKEIKTYQALALFLAKRESKEDVRVIPLSPTFYKERMKEAKKLVDDLRRPN